MTTSVAGRQDKGTVRTRARHRYRPRRQLAGEPAALLNGGARRARAIERRSSRAARPPCLVSFSGGRDSSAVLAIATALARREGLDLPIPATNIVRDAPAANEEEWQRPVISHLGLEEWVRIEHGSDLDVIGPIAQRLLERHGLLWPCNVHFHVPLLEAAHGGSLLTGLGGDELFDAMIEPRRPRRDLRGRGFDMLPASARRIFLTRRSPVSLPWLRPHANRALRAVIARERAAVPRALRSRLAWTRALRYLEAGIAALELVAADESVQLIHPLFGLPVWAAVADAAPAGYASRTAGMDALFGDLLASAVIARETKAHFDQAFWNAPSREFARTWIGTGVPEQWVDPGALAAHWQRPNPLAQSFTLLQAAWLESVHSLNETMIMRSLIRPMSESILAEGINRIGRPSGPAGDRIPNHPQGEVG